MMNYIWGTMIALSIIFSFFTNRLDFITNSIFLSTTQAIELTITMFGIISLWSGIMAILSKTNIMNIISKSISPFILAIFKGVDKKSKAFNYICLNFTANLLGLGNAATPLGLKATKELEKNNDSNNILKLILINTASLQLIPSTVIGLRSSLGSTNPNEIIPYIWICSLISLFSGLLCYKFLSRKEIK